MPDECLDVLVEQMHRAGERLIAAQAEQERLSELACKHSDNDELFKQWARSRRAIEECAQEYAAAVACCRYQAPDTKALSKGDAFSELG